MTSIARQVANLNDSDNMTLEHKNLLSMGSEIKYNHLKGQTIYIFEDNSALIKSNDNKFTIKPSYR